MDYCTKRIGKTEHRYDERYQQEMNRAKSKSWDVMLVVKLVAIPVVLILEGCNFSYFFLMALLFLHGLSMLIPAIYYRYKKL